MAIVFGMPYLMDNSKSTSTSTSKFEGKMLI